MGKSFFAVLFYVLGLSACQGPASDASSAAAPARLRVAMTNQPQSALIHVALAKGYFRDEKLDVAPIVRDSGKAALETVMANEADFGAVTETGAMFSVLEGEPLAIVATIATSNTNNAVVARRAAGIAAASDLKGKRVAYTPQTSSEFFLESLLTASGLTRAAIVPVPMRPREIEAALVAGDIDAGSLWAFWLVVVERRIGPGAVSFYDRELYTQTFNVAARQEFVYANRGLVVAFLRALLRAEDFIERDRPAALAIAAATMQVDVTLAGAMLDRFDHRVALEQSLLITLEDATRWAIKAGLGKRTDIPDYALHIDADALGQLRPESVRLKR